MLPPRLLVGRTYVTVGCGRDVCTCSSRRCDLFLGLIAPLRLAVCAITMLGFACGAVGESSLAVMGRLAVAMHDAMRNCPILAPGVLQYPCGALVGNSLRRLRRKVRDSCLCGTLRGGFLGLRGRWSGDGHSHCHAEVAAIRGKLLRPPQRKEYLRHARLPGRREGASAAHWTQCPKATRWRRDPSAQVGCARPCG
jgi:hypothetical protein